MADLAGERIVLSASDGMRAYHALARRLVGAGCDASRISSVPSHADEALMVAAGGCVSVGVAGMGLGEGSLPGRVAQVPLDVASLPTLDLIAAYSGNYYLASTFAHVLVEVGAR